MTFAIMRLEKLKDSGKIAAAAAHISRNIETPNADPTVKNRTLIDQAKGKPLHEFIDEHIARSVNKTVRKDAVRAFEFVLTASPDYFRPKTPDKAGEFDVKRMLAFEQKALQWIDKEFSRENIMLAKTHLDEATPHLQLIVTPIKDGRLCAKDWTGGKVKLSQLQDRFHDAVKTLGLKRGKKGSKAKHTTLKQYYGRVNQQVKANKNIKNKFNLEPLEITNKQFFESSKDFVFRVTSKQRKAAQDKVNQATDFAKTVHAKNRELKAENIKKTTEIEALRKYREQTEQIKNFDIEDVLNDLGAEQDRVDKKKWHTNAGPISVDGERFFNWHYDEGGGGAIDLVMHLHDCNFKKAVSILNAMYGAEIASEAVKTGVLTQCKLSSKKTNEALRKEVSNFKNALPVKSQVQKDILIMKEYLSSVRKIPKDFIDKLVDEGKIYASKSGKHVNIVFLNPENNSCEVVGTSEERFKKTIGKNHRWLIFNNRFKAESVVIVESAIDALSCCALGGEERAACSVAGAKTRSIKDLILGFKGEGRERNIGYFSRILCGYDNDEKGNFAAGKLKSFEQTIGRLKPDLKAKDWNEELIKRKEIELAEALEQKTARLRSGFSMNLRPR